MCWKQGLAFDQIILGGCDYKKKKIRNPHIAKDRGQRLVDIQHDNVFLQSYKINHQSAYCKVH